MNVRFCGQPDIYHLAVIIVANNLVQLCGVIPEDMSPTVGFELLTDSGRVYGNYQDYQTIYRQMEDGSIMLSNDGSVYAPPEPEPEPELPTPEELAEQERQKQIRDKQVEIESLKEQLRAGDYKVIKSYEQEKVGKEPDYDMTALHQERQAIRDAINALELQLTELNAQFIRK